MHKYCCLRVAIHTTERELELEVDSVFDRETLKTREGTKKVSHQMKWNLLIRRWFIARITFSSLPMHLGDCLNEGMCWMENDGAGKIWGSHLKVWKSHLNWSKSHQNLQSRTSFAQNRTSNHKSRTFQYGSQIYAACNIRIRIRFLLKWIVMGRDEEGELSDEVKSIN